jgi:DNA primase catalytic core
MSNTILDWVKEELYPSLFNSIDRALPEFEFIKKGKNWVSSNKLKITGEVGDSIGKVYVWETVPGCIKDFTRDTSGIVNYVMRRDGVTYKQAVETLAGIAGLKLPEGEFNQEDYQRYRDQATMLEDCNSYFVFCLENAPGAEEVRAYLSSRGYSPEDIKSMGLGYIPSQEKLFNYLLNTKGYNQSLIDEVLKIKVDTRIGSTHKLTISYRSGGYIKGFKFRTIGDATPKYLNSKDLDRDGGFFNLLGIKGDKDVVIVEGELDSLYATAKGVENVVATGGSSVSQNQVENAIKRGAKRFTLCFDFDKDKEDKTAKNITSAIDVLLKNKVNRIYIATLPDLGGDKTDPDSLIRESGVEAFKDVIKQSLPYYEYNLQKILYKYGKIQEERGELQSKDIDSLLDEVVGTASKIPDVIDKDRYKKLFTSLDEIKELGITGESLDITVDRLTSTREKEAQTKDLKTLLSKATQLLDKGEPDKAMEELSKVNEVKLKDKATEFSKLLLPIKESEMRERLSKKPESLKSGYTIGGEEIKLPSGAISIFAAPTSHGKTTLLTNMALNVVMDYPDKETYLFGYEEDGDSILINTLNVYLNREISANNRRSIRDYFATGSTEMVWGEEREYFEETKDKFFRELIDTRRLNIHYLSYNSDTLTEAIRYLHKNANPGAIFLDYIQLLNLPEGKYKTYSRQEEVKEICIGLKDISVETGLPIILGAQFNREVVNPLRIHPTKIGEAGDIERIANLIVGCYKLDMKMGGTDTEVKECKERWGNEPDTLYTTILKNRGGRVGLEEVLSFDGNTGKIKNMSSSNKIENKSSSNSNSKFD